ncbi:TatD family hydrolase, partial [Mycobacterium timonense]
GEVGLDYSRAGAATAKAQQRVFDVVLTEAQPGRHPLTVHSRGAEEDVVERLAAAGLPAVPHWYSGTLNLIGEALQAG